MVTQEETDVLPAALRRERMAALIADRQFVRVHDLSEAFGISEVTVRSDLDALDEAQAIRRVRGGAVPRRLATEVPFEEALTSAAAEKQRIGELAAAMVGSGSSVLLDVGTTTTALARALVARHELRDVVVVTNGLTVALELEAAWPRITVVVTGGTLRPMQHSLVEPMASLVLENIHADLAFIGCNGVDVEHGVTNVNLPEAEVKKRMVASATRVIVVADGSKLGQAYLGKVAPLSRIATLITGPTAPPQAVEHLRISGLDVLGT